MLTSHIYALNRRSGHLARSAVLKGHPPDGESFEAEKKKMKKEKKEGTEKRKEDRQTERSRIYLKKTKTA